jgi:hypothetical protein
MAAMAALFRTGVAVVGVVGAAVVGVVVGAAVVRVVEGVPDGLLQAANPRADADSSRRGRMRRRDTEADPFRRRAILKRAGASVAPTVVVRERAAESRVG